MAQQDTLSAPVITLPETDRVAFMVRVYQHLAVAIGVFVALETLLFTTGIAEKMYDFAAGNGWLLIFGLFMVGSWMASSAAHDLSNPGKQYGALFGMAAVYALIFTVPLYYTFNVEGSGTVASAAAVTGIGFVGLSAVAWTTRRDLSFMRPILMWGGFVAMGLIVASLLFSMQLGTWFSVAMIALMGISILYNTQTILRRYPANAHVGAAVNLFSSVMTLFWYVLRFMNRD